VSKTPKGHTANRYASFKNINIMNIIQKRLLTIIFVCGIISNVFSQDTITLYLDNDFVSTETNNAKFLREVVILNNHYFVTDSEINGQMVNYGEYSSVNPWIEDGLSVHYDDNGNKYSSGLYKNGNLEGSWTYFTNDKIDSVDYDIDLSLFYTVDCEKINIVKKKKKLKQVGAIHVDSITNYINKNFHFPARTKSQTKNFIQIINMVIDVDGKVKCPKIVNFINDDLSLEIFRILLQYKSKIEVTTPIPLSLSIDKNDERIKNDSDIYVIVESMPEFVGGMNQLYKYINANVTYTEKAKKAKVSGSVFISFIIDPDGSVTKPKIVKGIHPDLDSISLLIIKNMPYWIPGYQKGIPVSVKYNLPINFNLEQYNKSVKKEHQ